MIIRARLNSEWIAMEWWAAATDRPRRSISRSAAPIWWSATRSQS